MQNANDYRNLAATCRRAANMSRRPTPYLLDLTEHYDRRAAQFDARFAGAKPAALGMRDTEIEKPRR